jgi:hypothetical protein
MEALETGACPRHPRDRGGALPAVLVLLKCRTLVLVMLATANKVCSFLLLAKLVLVETNSN